MINKIKKNIIFFLVKLLPSTRCYQLKSRLLNSISGFQVSSSKIVSSVQFIGEGKIKIGMGSFIGHHTKLLTGKSSIIIEDNVDISSNVLFINGTHELNDLSEQPDRIAGKGKSNDIKVKRGAWIGASSTILGGVTVGEYSIVAAGSIVINDVPPRVIVAGNPATIKKLWSDEYNSWIKNKRF
jgi:acetyltransferase-like isoleucine patch superfamily enzyme